MSINLLTVLNYKSNLRHPSCFQCWKTCKQRKRYTMPVKTITWSELVLWCWTHITVKQRSNFKYYIQRISSQIFRLYLISRTTLEYFSSSNKLLCKFTLFCRTKFAAKLEEICVNKIRVFSFVLKEWIIHLKLIWKILCIWTSRWLNLLLSKFRKLLSLISLDFFKIGLLRTHLGDLVNIMI